MVLISKNGMSTTLSSPACRHWVRLFSKPLRDTGDMLSQVKIFRDLIHTTDMVLILTYPMISLKLLRLNSDMILLLLISLTCRMRYRMTWLLPLDFYQRGTCLVSFLADLSVLKGIKIDSLIKRSVLLRLKGLIKVLLSSPSTSCVVGLSFRSPSFTKAHQNEIVGHDINLSTLTDTLEVFISS